MEARRREIYEMLYPMARVGVRRRLSVEHESAALNLGESDNKPLDDTVSSSGESGSLNDDENTDLPPPYTQYAAEREGTSDRTVRRRLSVERESATLNHGEFGDEPLDEPGSSSGESIALKDDQNADLPPPYTRYAAEREGVTDRTVRNRLRIAEKLHPEVRDYIRGTPLADRPVRFATMLSGVPRVGGWDLHVQS